MRSPEQLLSTAVTWLEGEGERLDHAGLAATLEAVRRELRSGALPSFLFGSFEGYEIAQVIEHVASLAATGALFVSGSATWAVLWFDSGKVVHAESVGAVGRAAVRVCLNLHRGCYAFLPAALSASIPRTLTQGASVTGLLLDILRELDEQRAGRRPSQETSGAGLPDVELQLSPEEVLEVRKVALALRNAHMEFRRAELDAWYYREDASRVRRYAEAEQRSQARLWQWLAARSAFDVVDSLRALGSVTAQLEALDGLIEKAGERSVPVVSADGASAEVPESATWSALEDEE